MAKEMSVAEMNRQLKGIPDSDRHVGKHNGKPPKQAKGKSGQAKPEAEPKPPFRVTTMVATDTGLEKGDQESYERLDEVIAFVRKTITNGQGDGLHEVMIHIR